MDFKRINTSLDIHEVAHWVGLKENRSGFVLCPFHRDHKASMKLYKDSAYCFACNSWCDSIGLVAQVKGISQSEAVHLLFEAFSLPVEDIPFYSARRKRQPRNLTAEMISLWSKSVKQLLTCYVRKQAQRGVFCDWAEQILDDSFVLTEFEFYSRYNYDRRINAWLSKKSK